MPGRSRFADVVHRQLDLFVADEASLFEEAAAADAAWTTATRDESEELFGDYQLVVDQLAERLLDLREAYASTLEDSTSETYRAVFGKVARKRFRPYAGLLEET
ncbi:MAG: hypothetical protein H0U46_05550 [Actinobacteria bacterium]|nr:hypothetical protein [Actinomycetota bacterium]